MYSVSAVKFRPKENWTWSTRFSKNSKFQNLNPHNHILLNGTSDSTMHQQMIRWLVNWRNVEGSGSGLIWNPIPSSAWYAWEQSQESSVRIADLGAEIWTRDKKQKGYHSATTVSDINVLTTLYVGFSSPSTVILHCAQLRNRFWSANGSTLLVSAFKATEERANYKACDVCPTVGLHHRTQTAVIPLHSYCVLCGPSQ
jgi:hypothetical protein